MKTDLIKSLVLTMVLVFTGCSSTPTWHDISESDIAGWKSIGFDTEPAQNWKSDGFTPAQAKV